MFLKSLEIQGFKSFPDKTLLTFGKGVTAIVGPNGSGKSNISDAIRWVLGEMSAKTLRGSKMEDVIFGGAANRHAQGFAEVTLTIDNSDRTLAFDGDEVSVSRRFYRSGESEYKLNKTEVRLKDIYMLFMDTGLGRDGYSVISQGKIAEIISARSEDRREIFEEAAGVAKYRYRKEESERRLTAAEENLSRLRDILDELSSRLGPLQKQAEKAKRYIDLAGEKKKLEVGLWVTELDRQRDGLREHDNRLEIAHTQYEEIEEKLRETAANIEAAFLKAQQAAAGAEEHREAARRLVESAASKETQAALVENDMEHNQSAMERVRNEIAKAEALGESGGNEAREREKELQALKEEREKQKQELAAREEEILRLAGQGDELSSRIQDAGAALSHLNAKLNRLALEKSTAQSSSVHIEERLSAIKMEKEARIERQTVSLLQAQDAEKKLVGLNEKAQGHQNSLKGYELKLNSRREKLRAAEKEAASILISISEKSQRVKMLIDLERQMEGFSHSVKAVMREHEHGLLHGIHGPVSRIVQVPPEYSVAIETSLGAGAQNIVVSNEDDAKAAIAFLKKSDAGRATFLPLTSVKGGILSQNGLKECEGFIGLAYELVNYEKQYEGVVKSLLGRIAVVENLDAAIRIARKYSYAFRIVTLDGQLVNAGGSLTGGSVNRSAGLLSRQGQIQKLNAEVEKLKQELSGAEEAKKAAQAEVSSLEAAVSGINGELQTVQEDIIRAEVEFKNAKEQTALLGADIDALNSEWENASSRLAELTESVGGIQESMAAAEKEIAAAQSELEQLGVDKEEIVRQREEQSERLTALRLKIVGCEKDIDSAEAALAEYERMQTDREGKIEQMKAELAALEEKNHLAEENARSLRAQALEQRTLAAGEEEKAEKAEEQRQEIEKSGTQMRAAERGFSEDKEKISRELARLEERKASAQAEYDSLISRLLDEYELTRTEAEKVSERITDIPAASRRLNAVKREIKELGDINVGAIEEFKEVSERHKFLSEQTEDVQKSRAELLSLISELTQKMREIFAQRFDEINHNFSLTFVELFGGGSAKLTLTDPSDVLTSGIEITVQPPGKIIKSLTALSGGEQAFVAISLYFAIFKVRPSPFCVLDEIEAALDDANVARFAAYLKRISNHTQFIVITHRRGTMDAADVLYGVTMQDEGVSKLLTLNVEEMLGKLGIEK